MGRKLHTNPALRAFTNQLGKWVFDSASHWSRLWSSTLSSDRRVKSNRTIFEKTIILKATKTDTKSVQSTLNDS